MAAPAIEARLQRKFIVMTRDAGLLSALRAALPEGWKMVEVLDLGEIGAFQDILLYRFILLDLDESVAFDPVKTIRKVRMEYMLNVPVFCFGGTAEARDEARLARADRFFGRAEIAEKLPLFCAQHGW